MATLTRGSDLFDSSRYKYDTGLCSSSKGWAQVDTTQDASYYGTWTNPTTFEIFNYCEGDLTHTKCADEAEYILEINKTIAWNQERGYWLGIDPGWPDTESCDRIKAAFTRMGLAEYLH